MNAERPSQTASMVAALRALGNQGLTTAQGFSDPTAQTMLSPNWARVSRWIERTARALPNTRRRRILHTIDVLPLRTLAIDAELVAAVARGTRQLVILGAGLDGRAYRMNSLAAVKLFEVDHPATQAYKKRRAASLLTRCAEQIFVPVDFEREVLTERLAAAGHDASVPTVWIWEGVTMYLTDAGLRSTLEAVAARSAAGSTLIAQYGEPWPLGPYRWSVEFLLKLWSEPHIGARRREMMKAEIERVGLRLVSDSGTVEWAARFGADPPDFSVAHTRAAVALKDSAR